jgi:DNA-binding MarR family transcriptional regulator
VRTFSSLPDGDSRPALTDVVDELQGVMRMLTGVALRSLQALDGAVTLPQFRLLAVVGDLGQARSAQVARALALEASTVTRLADRLVASGHVVRGGDPGHRGVVTLGLTPAGQQLVRQVAVRRREELGRIVEHVPAGQHADVVTALRLLLEAAGPGYGFIEGKHVPV